jgi:hypothetical protein
MSAVKKLRSHDHDILKVEAARRIAASFGLKEVPIRTFEVGQDKVWTLYGKQRARGVDAAELAEDIASFLRLQYPSMLGVGSRLRVACDAIENYLGHEKHN